MKWPFKYDFFSQPEDVHSGDIGHGLIRGDRDRQCAENARASAQIKTLMGNPRAHRSAERKESMMRTLQGHKVNPANDTLNITVMDEPGSGGANHAYRISGFDLSSNQSAGDGITQDASTSAMVYFQNGPIAEVGVNGLTHEALLEIVADRLRSFQKGPFACKANACALTHIEEAQHWLQQRTLERMRRGVEGTHTV